MKEVIAEKRKMSPAQKAALAKGREALAASGKSPIKKKAEEEKPEAKKDDKKSAFLKKVKKENVSSIIANKAAY